MNKYDYNTLSRNGLVEMANDFDEENNGALSTFAAAKEEAGNPYQLITPAEFVFSNFTGKKDEFVDHLKQKIDGASDTLDRVVNAIFSGEDEIASKLIDETTEAIFGTN